MPVINGNTSGSYNSASFTNPAKIMSFSFANRTGGAVTVSIGIFYGSSITYILYNTSLPTAESYIYSGEPIILPSNHQIYINVSGSTDYYISLNME